jgi:hypothetical protein
VTVLIARSENKPSALIGAKTRKVWDDYMPLPGTGHANHALAHILLSTHIYLESMPFRP